VKKIQLFKPREKFLVLEITPSGVSGLFLSVDEERNLVFEKFVRGIDLQKFLKSPVRGMTQKSWEGNYFFKSHRKVIAAVDPSLATTIPVPLDLPRNAGTEHAEIALTELENMIAQAMGKIFNQCRAEAAKRLAIHEIDTIMVGAKARSFMVDGHRVVNPVGFTGKKISLLLELTFTGRVLFEDLKEFFNSPDDFFFAESPQARLTSLARARKLPLNLVVDEGPRGSSVFILQKTKDDHPVLYREKMQWSFDALFLRIAADLGVSDATAKDLYRSCIGGGMSESAARAFKKVIDPAVAAFFKEGTREKLQGFIYVDADHDMPFALPHRRNGMVFDQFPAEEIVRQLGFGDAELGDIPRRAVFRNLLPFVEAYFDKSNSEINQKLRRRLHWLVD
jgi:hypothetical protein